MIETWIDQVGLSTLLESTPRGLLVGCGGSSEYLAYVMRTRPAPGRDLFEVNRQGSYYDTSIEEKGFTPDQLPLVLDEIEERMKSHGYARISFHDGKEEETQVEILEGFKGLIFNRPPPVLFDHSFILLPYRGSIWRFESYIDQYNPRAVEWSTYRDDLIRLFQDPHSVWKEIFGVDCHPKYDLSKVSIDLTN